MSNINLVELTLTGTNLVTTNTSAAFSVAGAKSVSVQYAVDVNTPAAKTCPEASVDVTANTFTIAAHGFTTGLKVGATSDATLPSPLTATDYFVIVVDATTIKLATTLVLAQAGTAIDILDDGSAASTTTFTPTALASASVKLQKSNDGLTWADEGTATTITVDAAAWLEKVDPTSYWMRLYETLAAGRMSSGAIVIVKGPA